MTSLSLNWVKRAQCCIPCIKGDRKIKINIWWNFEVGSLFLRSFSQIIAVLIPVMTSSKIESKRAKTCISCTNGDRKMKSNSKGKFRWIIRFWNHYLKILKFWLSWRLSPTQKWVKKFQIGISCISIDRKMKIKVKGTLRQIICLWNRSLKALQFWLNLVTSSTQNWLEKRPKLVFIY